MFLIAFALLLLWLFERRARRRAEGRIRHLRYKLEFLEDAVFWAIESRVNDWPEFLKAASWSSSLKRWPGFWAWRRLR